MWSLFFQGANQSRLIPQPMKLKLIFTWFSFAAHFCHFVACLKYLISVLHVDYHVSKIIILTVAASTDYFKKIICIYILGHQICNKYLLVYATNKKLNCNSGCILNGSKYMYFKRGKPPVWIFFWHESTIEKSKDLCRGGQMKLPGIISE